MNQRGEIYAIETPTCIYVGSALGSSVRRWSAHMRLLKAGRHHCQALQAAFTGIESLTFRVLETGILRESLLRQEYIWNLKLEAISAKPGKAVRDNTRNDILSDIRAGITYRAIAAKHGVSLGTVSRIKSLHDFAAASVA